MRSHKKSFFALSIAYLRVEENFKMETVEQFDT